MLIFSQEGLNQMDVGVCIARYAASLSAYLPMKAK